jgi:hypothetical protein
VICGGMSHSELQVPMKVGETLITHDACYGRTVGLMKTSFGHQVDAGLKLVYFASELVPMDGKWVENSNYMTWLSSFQPQFAERMGLIVGTSAVPMSDVRVHSSETELGNYVCDLLRQHAGADVALLPAAFFQGSLPKGPVTLGDLYSVLPFDHYGVVFDVTGGELQQILNDAADQIGKEGFPQVSGVSFGIFDGKSYQVRVNGTEIDPFASYKLATSDFLASGVLGYATLGTIASRGYTGRLIRDIVREQLAGGQLANSTLYQRITFLAQAPPTAPPAEETAEASIEGTPAGEEAPAGELTLPEETMPAEAEAPPADEPLAAGQEDGLDTLKYDRNGQPLTIDDEVVQDTGSEAETVPAEEAPAEQPAETQPPAIEETPPAASAESPAASGAVLGSARTSSAGLEYEFLLYATDAGYEFQLKVTNSSSSPVELSYATNERFDFIVLSGTDMLWHYNINRFFVQSPLTETIGAGERIVYRGNWSGTDKKEKPIPLAQYRFEAVHQLAAGPVQLGFEANLAR